MNTQQEERIIANIKWATMSVIVQIWVAAWTAMFVVWWHG